MAVSPTQTGHTKRYWPSARHFTEAIQCPSVCFAHPLLRDTLPAVDRLGMPIVTSGQFAYVYKLKSLNGGGDFAVRCFRGYLGDRDQRYRAIQDHLRTAPVSYLSEFTYASEGILVGGNRFPILFMNWINGPTLDLYIGEMLHRPDVLLHLSEELLKLVSTLRSSGVAHGDLQHGNIIVEHGQLRLVDHDGIFVTQMAGWSASEVGHQHYQHPRRTAHHFDAQLDYFSSLVIYLSLLSLAERPALWTNITTRTCCSPRRISRIRTHPICFGKSGILDQSTAGWPMCWPKPRKVPPLTFPACSIWWCTQNPTCLRG